MQLSITHSASERILDLLRFAEATPECRGLIPVLCLFFNYQRFDEEGKVTESYPYEHFEIGWDHPDVASANSFVEIELNDFKIYVTPDCVEALAEKVLAFETVEVGYPTPATKTVQLLVAR